MIVVDGQETQFKIQNFDNLEQLLVKVMGEGQLEDRVVTDVLVNDEAFSEIYPHQAEDIAAGTIQRVEIRTVGVSEMAVNIAVELEKVVTIMDHGATAVSEMFRRADDGEALELFQDLVDVTRNFFGMIGVLRDEFSLTGHEELAQALEELSELFSEMIEVTDNEDWILLADLLEYEFVPAVKRWQGIITALQAELSAGRNN